MAEGKGFRPDQVQAFLPSPMASATAMYHTGYNPLSPLRLRRQVHVEKSLEQRRLHKAFLRYHDPNNWPILRAALIRMGRSDLDRQRQASPHPRLSARRHWPPKKASVAASPVGAKP